MKIVILGPAYPYRGGIAALNERLGTQLQAEGHAVHLVTFTLQYPGFLFPGKTQFTTGNAPDKLKIDRKINSINPINWLQIGNTIRKAKPDLVIARFWIPFIGPSLGTICRIIRRNRYTRIIALADNIIPHEHKPGDRALTSFFLNSCHGVVVMSKSVLSELNTFDTQKPRRYGPHPIYDHYGKIESRENALLKLKLDPDFSYLLFFGLIRDYKGLDLVIDAMADTRLSTRNLKLIVAGEFYSNEEKYRQQVNRLGLNERVVFVDQYIPNEEVEHYFNAADMVVQPYKNATQSGVTQVAYHFNKPMLVTNVGGLPEIVPHGRAGYVCSPDAGEIASGIDDFYSNDRKLLLKKTVIEEKKRFAWDIFTQLFYDLLKEINDEQDKR